MQCEVQRGAPTVAAEAKRTISSIFEFAVATLRADSDPVWAIRKALPANKTQHKKALTTDQIGQLLNNFDNSRGTFQLNYCGGRFLVHLKSLRLNGLNSILIMHFGQFQLSE